MKRNRKAALILILLGIISLLISNDGTGLIMLMFIAVGLITSKKNAIRD